MKLLAFTSSLRQGSFNLKLVRLAVEIARRHGAEVDLADFSDFDVPSYDGDLEEKGFPPGALKFAGCVKATDGLLISLPEYNFSMPGNFKNAVDWVSRMRPIPFQGKSALLLAASVGAVGGCPGPLAVARTLGRPGGSCLSWDVYPGPFRRSLRRQGIIEGRGQPSALGKDCGRIPQGGECSSRLLKKVRLKDFFRK